MQGRATCVRSTCSPTAFRERVHSANPRQWPQSTRHSAAQPLASASEQDVGYEVQGAGGQGAKRGLRPTAGRAWASTCGCSRGLQTLLPEFSA